MKRIIGKFFEGIFATIVASIIAIGYCMILMLALIAEIILYFFDVISLFKESTHNRFKHRAQGN